MQNVTIAIIIITFELLLSGLAGLAFLCFRRGGGGKVRGGHVANAVEQKQLAHRLAHIHGILMAQYAALTREFTLDGSDHEAWLAAEAAMRKSIEQLRFAASQLALGVAGSEQISLDLLGVQESLLVAFDAYTRIDHFRTGDENESSATNGQPPVEEKLAEEILPLADEAKEPQPGLEISEAAFEPPLQSPPVINEPETKMENDLQAEIEALMSPPIEMPQPEKIQPEEPLRKKTEAEIEAEMQADLEAMIEGAQSAAPVSENSMQTELLPEMVSSHDQPEPPPRKMTEAEIEAEMQAELDAMLAASKSAVAAPDPQSEIDNLLNQSPSEIDALLNQNHQGVAPVETESLLDKNVSEEEIDPGIQAELEALLAPGWQAGLEQKSPEDDLQAEIDALLGGAFEPPKTANTSIPPSAPPPPQQQQSDLDLQAEIDALLAGGGEEPEPPVIPRAVEPASPGVAPKAQCDLDLQDEIDALLAGGGEDLPTTAPTPSGFAKTQSDLDLQAEIDALLGEKEEKPKPEIRAQAVAKPEPALSQADLDLQAEIDALMAGEQKEPESPALQAINKISRQSESVANSSDLSNVIISQTEIDALLGADASASGEDRMIRPVQARSDDQPSPAADHKEKAGNEDVKDLQAEIDALLSSAGK